MEPVENSLRQTSEYISLSDLALERLPSISSVRSSKVELRKGGIQGYGIFATEPISKGEVVFIKGGHIVSTTVAEEVDRTLGDYSMQIDDDFFLAPLTTEEVPQVVVGFNHSCNPNAGPTGQIVFVALRDIERGEEITTDYAMTVDTSNRKPYQLQCDCGSAQCRGVITGLDWQRSDLQDRYGEHFSTFILRKIQALQ